MPRKKTARKTAKRRKTSTAKKRGRGTGRPFTKGKDSRRGVGRKGRSGRVPSEVKVDCQETVFVIALPKIVRYLRRRGKTADDAGWRWAVDLLFDRGFGRVPLPITGDEEGDPIAVKVERAKALKGRLLERLARIAAREEKTS